ncbi:MAG TPA: hypothetical protein VD907_05725 [Verrucomicrobiae bacterium]|nr:hypothetical protein [Verrucomicrobiae bacterium]
MLGQIAIIVDDKATHAYLHGYGDEELLKSLTFEARGETLSIKGSFGLLNDSISLSSRRFKTLHFAGSGVVVGCSTTTSGRTFASSDEDLFVDGRQIDLSRPITLAVVVPPHMAASICNTIGAIGVHGTLGGKLKVKGFGPASIVAQHISSLTCDLSCDSWAMIDTASGKLKLDLSSGANVAVTEGFTTTVKADLSSNSQFVHGGVITGNANLDVSSGAEVVLASVLGKVKRDIHNGSVTVNGVQYTS